MPGHAEAVVSLSFSPDNNHLASGSGDTTLRLWDLTTETPHFTCTGHKQWVLCVAWAPNSKKVASACKAGEIRVWDPDTGNILSRPMIGHKKWINCLSWQPYHQDPECRLLASAGSDGDIRIWDTVLGQTVKTLAGHTASVTAVRWGGGGLLYSSSRDRTIKMWRAEDGVMCKTFTGHAHWVNNLALNTDYVLRTGPFHPVIDREKSYKMKDSKYSSNQHHDVLTKLNRFFSEEELRKAALERYRKVCPDDVESLVSCSDDFTLYLWRNNQKQFITRMTGHQNVVNDVKYSPDVK
jgi:ribosome assembly protein 4